MVQSALVIENSFNWTRLVNMVINLRFVLEPLDDLFDMLTGEFSVDFGQEGEERCELGERDSGWTSLWIRRQDLTHYL